MRLHVDVDVDVHLVPNHSMLLTGQRTVSPEHPPELEAESPDGHDATAPNPRRSKCIIPLSHLQLRIYLTTAVNLFLSLTLSVPLLLHSLEAFGQPLRSAPAIVISSIPPLRA